MIIAEVKTSYLASSIIIPPYSFFDSLQTCAILRSDLGMWRLGWKKLYEVVGRWYLCFFSIQRIANGRRGSAVFLLVLAINGAVISNFLTI